MDEKTYEAGRVEISSAEYRDLVTEAVKNQEVASQLRSEKWKLESEVKALKEELACAMKHVDELKATLNKYEFDYCPRIFAHPGDINIARLHTKEEN